MFDLFTQRLEAVLAGNLPGLEVQMEMAPQERRRNLPSPETIEKARKSGVLVLVYPHSGEPHVVLMKRASSKGVHSGQISFPGGKAEEYDADLVQTALREANEEVGVLHEQVKILGQLSPMYIPPSNFYVEPALGITAARPEFVPDPSEVDQIIEVPLDYLADPAIVGRKEINVRGFTFETPYYDVFGHTVWGATAMMVSELVAIVRQTKR